MELLTNRKYWPWFYLLAVFAILWVLYNISFQIDTANRGNIVRDYINDLSVVQRANALGKLQDGGSLQIPKGLGTYSLEVESSDYFRQMKSDDLPDLPQVYGFIGSDKRVIFINDSVFYFFNGTTFQIKKLDKLKLDDQSAYQEWYPVGVSNPRPPIFSGESNLENPSYNNYVVLRAINKSKQRILVVIDYNGGWWPIDVDGLSFSPKIVRNDLVTGVAFDDSLFCWADILQIGRSVTQLSNMNAWKMRSRLLRLVQVDTTHLVFTSRDTLLALTISKNTPPNRHYCDIDRNIDFRRELLNGVARQVGNYLLFFNASGSICKLDLKTFKVNKEPHTISGLNSSIPELFNVGNSLVGMSRSGDSFLVIQQNKDDLKYSTVQLNSGALDDVFESQYSFSFNDVYRLDWTTDGQYKLSSAAIKVDSNISVSTWAPQPLALGSDTVAMNGFNFVVMPIGTRFMAVAAVNTRLPFYAFYQQSNGKMDSFQLGSLTIEDEMIESLTIVPNPYIIIVFSAFMITLISLGFVMVKDVSSATEPQTQASDFKLWNLRDRIVELNKTTTHLKVRYNVMLFLGIIFGVGGVVSFYIVLRYTIHVDGKGVFDNEENIVNLIRAVVLLTFIETFTFFFLKQYRVIFNEYKLFLSVKFRLSNFFHALEVNQSDQIAAPLKKDIIKKIMDENYRLSIDDPRMLTEDLVRSNQQLLENVLNKALDEFKNK